MNTIRIIDKITKVFESYDGVRKRHTIYKAIGKVGTTSTTIIYFIDKVPNLNEYCWFIDSNNISADPFDKKSNFIWVCTPYIHYGFCDRINDDGYCFVSYV